MKEKYNINKTHNTPEKYSRLYYKKIGVETLIITFNSLEQIYSEKGKLYLMGTNIGYGTGTVCTVSLLFRDYEFAFLTSEQDVYINSLECDDVAKWEEIKKISDKVIKWNI